LVKAPAAPDRLLVSEVTGVALLIALPVTLETVSPLCDPLRAIRIRTVEPEGGVFVPASEAVLELVPAVVSVNVVVLVRFVWQTVAAAHPRERVTALSTFAAEAYE
jgi:hypothetical protein